MTRQVTATEIIRRQEEAVQALTDLIRSAHDACNGDPIKEEMVRISVGKMFGAAQQSFANMDMNGDPIVGYGDE